MLLPTNSWTGQHFGGNYTWNRTQTWSVLSKTSETPFGRSAVPTHRWVPDTSNWAGSLNYDQFLQHRLPRLVAGRWLSQVWQLFSHGSGRKPIHWGPAATGFSGWTGWNLWPLTRNLLRLTIFSALATRTIKLSEKRRKKTVFTSLSASSDWVSVSSNTFLGL